ncbi:MAG: PKD domain-containing protein [Candidatus Omnitrophota bacterium]
MRKILVLLFIILILSGCATYKFQKPAGSSADKGYLVSYDGKPIIEYTVGKEKSLPDLTLAKERFKRRRATVEYYYKKMDLIESRFKEYLWGAPSMFVDFVGGVLCWPFTAVADYKYNHNPKYKTRVDKLEEEKESFEKARIGSLKEKLETYIVKDLSKENLPVNPSVVVPIKLNSEEKILPTEPVVSKLESQPAIQEAAFKPVVTQVLPVQAQDLVVAPPPEGKPVIVEAPVTKKILELPVASITANPVKGFSPLKVKFSGQKSYSKSGKIVSYLWDFGDGDKSSKKNPENTYWSATYGSRNYTATLTVKDEAGGVSSTTAIIEVSTP